MSSGARAQALAIAGAILVFLVLLLALRLRSWLPFVGAALTYLALLYAWRAAAPPRPRPRPGARAGARAGAAAGPAEAPLPEGVGRDDHRAALDTLARARRELEALAAGAPPADAPTVRRMAALVDAIRRHHEANPGHVPRTRPFLRHALPRMVAAVAGYVDLARRARPAPGNSAPDNSAPDNSAPDGPAPDGPARGGNGHDDRLAEIARRIEGFVPALERIDRACLEDDLLALEITVEVLNEQLGRRDRGGADA
jgi:hypothetical protein